MTSSALRYSVDWLRISSAACQSLCGNGRRRARHDRALNDAVVIERESCRIKSPHQQVTDGRLVRRVATDKADRILLADEAGDLRFQFAVHGLLAESQRTAETLVAWVDHLLAAAATTGSRGHT